MLNSFTKEQKGEKQTFIQQDTMQLREMRQTDYRRTGSPDV